MKLGLLYLILFTKVMFADSFFVKNVNEIKSILKKIKPGDSIVLQNGEWRDAKILFEADGSKEKTITLKAESAGRVLLTGASSLRIAGDYLVVDGLQFKDGTLEGSDVIEFRKNETRESNFSRLTNCSIVDYSPQDDKKENKWVSLYGSHNRVDHCYFKNKSNEGCLLVVWLSDKPNYHLIDSNYFAYRPELGRNGAEIIRVGTSDWSMHASNTIVEYNYFEQCNGEREIISNKSFYNKYRYNTFVECKGALTLRHGNNCEVYGNFFFGNKVKGTGGVRIIGEGHKVYNNYFQELEGEDAFSALSIMNGVPNSPLNRYFQVKEAVIVFNTFVNNKHTLEIGVGKSDEVSLPPVNCLIANNIFYSTKGQLIKFIDIPKSFKWINNTAFGSPLGIDSIGGINIVDPLLEQNDWLYRLAKESSIIGKAVGDYEFVRDDIDGQCRKINKTPGCDEVLSDQAKRRPMNANNTGPNWMK